MQGDEAIPDISRSSERKGAFSRALAASTLLANRPIRSQLITAALAGRAIVIIAFVTREQLAEHVDERVHYFVTLGVAGMVLVALRPHLFVISSVSLITLASLVVIDGWPTTASQQMAVAIFLFAMFLRSEEHTSELQSLMRTSYSVFS